MKRLITLIFAALFALQSIAGPFAISSGSAAAFKFIANDTYTNITTNYPAASYTGYQAFVTDLGANGTLCRSNGTRWLPVNGVAVLKQVVSLGPYTNSETISMQTLIPAGFLAVGDVLRVRHAVTKSGTTDSGMATGRIGTVGTTSDTAITNYNATTILAATNQAGGFDWEIAITSATTALKLGLSGAGSYTGATNTAAGAATTISNISNALYFSTAVLSSGATNTVSIQSARIELITGN